MKDPKLNNLKEEMEKLIKGGMMKEIKKRVAKFIDDKKQME